MMYLHNHYSIVVRFKPVQRKYEEQKPNILYFLDSPCEGMTNQLTVSHPYQILIPLLCGNDPLSTSTEFCN